MKKISYIKFVGREYCGYCEMNEMEVLAWIIRTN